MLKLKKSLTCSLSFLLASYLGLYWWPINSPLKQTCQGHHTDHSVCLMGYGFRSCVSPQALTSFKVHIFLHLRAEVLCDCITMAWSGLDRCRSSVNHLHRETHLKTQSAAPPVCGGWNEETFLFFWRLANSTFLRTH